MKMEKLSIALAVLALVATAMAAKNTTTAKTEANTYVFRQTCVDSKGQTQTAGAVWYEGVNGCLKLTCTNGVAMGTDSCTCTYPDGSTGKGGDVWYSVPTCQSCTCQKGTINCTTLQNCIKPTTTTTTTPTATVTSCTGPDSLAMNLGDMYIEGCMNCTCTSGGLSCNGVIECPGTTATSTSTGECFMGFLGFVDANVADEYVSEGYVFTEACNTCTCTGGTFLCDYTCTSEETVTAVETETETENAELDCDVGDGIVLNGDYYTNTCGVSCQCQEGVMSCPSCTTSVSTTTVTPTVQPTSVSVCVATDGSVVENGAAYKPAKCTNCTCVNGVFTCVKTCDRDCTTSSGKVVTNGSKYLATCSSCKCNDGTLTCTNTCAGKVCKVPNSSKTVAQGKTLKIDSCIKCKCTSTILLQCRDYCETTTPCLCEGRILKSGKTRTTKCTKYTCNGGKLSSKKVC